ncbi:MAG: sigma-70 family RNA polymerase sigma factor [Alphaproteobacteria bacterium]|nr:sigma-70 family RNA polymerase sigma factor [Alphaproteobacteria bacterium]
MGRRHSEVAMELDIADLYRRYGDLVLGRCRTLMRNEADAQEACQDVFLRMHRYRSAFRHEASPSTYLFRVTTTTCLNRIRSRKRRREELQDEPMVVPVADSVLNNHEVRDLVERLLEGVDPKTQACVIYHFVDGMTYQEIGDLMGLSAAAIRKRVGGFRRAVQNNPPAWLSELED